MVSVSRIVAALMALLLVTSCVGPEPHAVASPVPTQDVPPTAAKNIHRYVGAHRGWNRSVYHIERYPDEHGYALFAVVHRHDETDPPSVGRGKSFALYCDPHTYKVVREMWFQ
jgi:hypothetical protein